MKLETLINTEGYKVLFFSLMAQSSSLWNCLHIDFANYNLRYPSLFVRKYVIHWREDIYERRRKKVNLELIKIKYKPYPKKKMNFKCTIHSFFGEKREIY